MNQAIKIGSFCLIAGFFVFYFGLLIQ